MSSNLIASTPKAEMNALAYKGIMAYASFPQIRDMLLRKFGDDFVLLFAKPVENVSDGVIDWYTPVQGEAKRIIDIPEEQRQPILESLQNMGEEILAFADELIQSHDPLKLTRGNILKLALSFPSEADLYLVGEQPVYTCWGFAPGRPGVEAMNLSKLVTPVAREPRPVPPVQPETAPPSQVIEEEKPREEPATRKGCAPVGCLPAGCLGGGCLWWLFPLLPLLLLLLLLFTSFGFLPALSGYSLLHLPLPEALEPKDDHLARINTLETDIENLKAQLKKHVALCEPPAQAQKKPETPGALVIPEDATDTSFMKGRWLCRTGLSSSLTHEPVQLTFSFGEDGKGDAMVIEKNDKCKGDAMASMQGHTLHIDIGELTCGRQGGVYNSSSIDCENAEDSSTKCYGVNKNGTKWEAVFIKMR